MALDKSKPVPYELSPDDDVEIVMDAFRILFSEEVDAVYTKHVRAGGTSDAIFVPKRHGNCVATVIIWKNKDKYMKEDKLVDKEGNKVEDIELQ